MRTKAPGKFAGLSQKSITIYSPHAITPNAPATHLSLCRPSRLAEPDPVLLHFRALFRRRVAAAG